MTRDPEMHTPDSALLGQAVTLRKDHHFLNASTDPFIGLLVVRALITDTLVALKVTMMFHFITQM